jgi:hypothetical protein
VANTFSTLKTSSTDSIVVVAAVDEAFADGKFAMS